MAGASVEATLELWASSLREVKARMRPLFTQERVAASAGQFLDGLLGNERRKTGWMRAEAAGDPGPGGSRRSWGAGGWDADALRDMVRDYALETLADEDAVLVIDETGFLKQGKASCGVARQYTGSAGKITNCQIGVFAAYVSRHGHAFIDRALYLPKDWTDDPSAPERRRMCRTIGFATKPQIARADDRSGPSPPRCRLPGGRPTASMASARSRWPCAEAGKGYVLGVAANQCSTPGASKQFVRRDRRQRSPRASIPERLAAPVGRAKEPRASGCTTGPISNWPISKPANTTTDLAGPWTRGLLIRRNIADGDLAFFSTWCPAGTPIGKLVAVEGHRWAIEDSFETAKNELGLDHNETRSWHGWHRHVSLVMLAFAMMAAIRHKANTPRRQKTACRRFRKTPLLIRWSIQEIRRIAIKLGPTPHPTRRRHRLVPLATRPSSRSTRRTSQKKNATVMLVRSFGPRMVCTHCGIIGADARPNWQEMPRRQTMVGSGWSWTGTPSMQPK